MTKRTISTLLSLITIFTLLLTGTGGRAAYQTPVGVTLQTPPGDTVAINGIAYWGTTPTGPDFQGVQRIPFQARNPSLAAWRATQTQVRRLMAETALPQNIQVSYSGVVPGASHLINDFSEVMVYLDPTNPQHLLGSSKFFFDPANYGFYTGVFESYDGGLTWTELQPAGVETYGLTSDPVNTFDELGNGYFTLLTRSPTGLDMLKKPITGTWELPVIVDRTTSTDKQWIMGDQNPASPHAGNLYMSWTSFGGPVTGIVLSRSTNRNLSWTAPIALAGGDVQGSMPGVAPDGTVYVMYGVGIFYGGAGTQRFVKSTNGGVSFSAPRIAANITAIPYTFPNSDFRTPASMPAFAVSPVNGDLYMAWADYRNGDADIYFTRSTNGGTGWTFPVRLNDDPLGNGVDQWQPQISVSPNGRVAVMWFDRRLPCPDLPWIPVAHRGAENFCIDTFMTRSYDRGQSWMPNLRASAQTWDWSLNLPRDGSGNGFIGDYQGIASNNAFDFPFWNATANLGANAQNYQEIFIARVPVPTGDLTRSTKTVSPEIVAAGSPMTYTITLDNAGPHPAPGVWVTDTLPVSLTYVTGSLDFLAGSGGYDPATHAITWTGEVTLTLPVTISFQAAPEAVLPVGTVVTNTALIRGTSGEVYTRTAAITVAQPPVILATTPAEGAQEVAIASSVVVTFSEPINPSTLAYTVTPNPGGLAAAWSAGNTRLVLMHAPFAYSQPYTVTLAAKNMSGLPLGTGPAPNPWHFTTVSAPPSILATFPAEGAIEVPITASLEITFSAPVITSTLAYTVTVDPGGWSVVWNAEATRVTLRHTEFAYSQTYTVTVAVKDALGRPLGPGPAVNPWHFTTRAQPLFDLFLPGIWKMGVR